MNPTVTTTYMSLTAVAQMAMMMMMTKILLLVVVKTKILHPNMYKFVNVLMNAMRRL